MLLIQVGDLLGLQGDQPGAGGVIFWLLYGLGLVYRWAYRVVYWIGGENLPAIKVWAAIGGLLPYLLADITVRRFGKRAEVRVKTV